MNCLIITVVVIIAVSTILWKGISLIKAIFLENKKEQIFKLEIENKKIMREYEVKVKKENEERDRQWKLEDEAKK